VPSEIKGEQETNKSEFTPPPTTLRDAVFGKANAGTEAGELPATELATKESVSETTDDTTESEQGIEELEAEKGAVLSLKNRLEEMKSSGTIESALYEKLSKKYTSEIERIDKKIEKLAQKEKKKTTKN
jgi:vacuolar-type H+-ATPase subunit I/STV1